MGNEPHGSDILGNRRGRVHQCAGVFANGYGDDVKPRYRYNWRAGLLAAALLLSTAAHADSWTTADKWRQVTYTALHLADWSQTRQIARDWEYDETNPIMGPTPTAHEVDRYFMATLFLHAIVADSLPQRYRKTFQHITIGVQIGAVTHNYRMGYIVKF